MSKPLLGVIYLRVELHAVEFLLNVLDSGVGALGSCDRTASKPSGSFLI